MAARFVRLGSVVTLALIAACRIETSDGGDPNDPDGDGKPGKQDSPENRTDESDAQKEAEKDTPTAFTGTQIRYNDADKGVADPAAEFRALVVVPFRDSAALRNAVTAMYTPGDPTFRKYLSKSAFMDTYAPAQETIAEVSSFFTSNGMKV